MHLCPFFSIIQIKKGNILIYQKTITQEEKNFYKCLDRLDNSYELLAIVFKDLGLKMKPWDIKRELNVMKFDVPKEDNKYYNKYEKYILRVLELSENEVRKYFLENPNIKDDFKELDFQREDKKIKEIKDHFMILGASEKMCKLIAYRELELEDHFRLEIGRKEKIIRAQANKIKELQSKTKVFYQSSMF